MKPKQRWDLSICLMEIFLYYFNELLLWLYFRLVNNIYKKLSVWAKHKTFQLNKKVDDKAISVKKLALFLLYTVILIKI